MNLISFIKSKLRPFKNRLYSLSLYLKNYDDNDEWGKSSKSQNKNQRKRESGIY